MNKQPERTDATRCAIMDTFWQLYESKQTDRISAREVAELAHVHRSTFYRYFTSVYDVLDQFEAELLDDMAQNTEEVLRESAGGDFASISETLVRTLSLYADKLCHLLGPSGDPMFRARFAKRFALLFERTMFVQVDSFKVGLLVELSLSIVLTDMSFWYEHKDECSLEEVCAVSRTLVEDGVAKLVG